ncbi:MAG TPA: hypothetical protein VG056_02205 [Pirellulales bacterium]|jgi:hypothetical protein|nr:hypothetical protein [Pirellulales bacterium]
MDDTNPYESPAVEPISKGRPPMRIAGGVLIALGLLMWLPMMIGAFGAAITHPEKDLWVKLGAGSFNGLVMWLLLRFGRRLWRGTLPN